MAVEIVFYSLLVFFGFIGAVIYWGGPKRPPLLETVNRYWNEARAYNLPQREYFKARDNCNLAFRPYLGYSGDIPAGHVAAILCHGSSMDSHNMHLLGVKLAQQNISAFALDIRGHGASGNNKGDISYVGQLEDDLEDFINFTRSKGFKNCKLILVGFSSGGGFVLRVAGQSRLADYINAFVTLTPFIHHKAKACRPNAGGWIGAGEPRFFGLSILKGLRINLWGDLPVVSFALDSRFSQSHTLDYSFRLQENYRPFYDYRKNIAEVRKSLIVIIGEDDEMFNSSEYPSLFKNSPYAEVILLPGLNHMQLVAENRALEEIVLKICTAAERSESA